MATVKTRVLILSDTHGKSVAYPHSGQIDVAIHCGDLTNSSNLHEFTAGVAFLRSLNAPLKLVIAGNHDFTLDDAAYADVISRSLPAIEADLALEQFGMTGEARQVLEDAKQHGIIFLEEGNHEFILHNGARLKVYASPYTPGEQGWAFEYPPSSKHNFAIAADTDIAITHGPPQGLFDRTREGTRAGCPELFKAVAGVRPLIHCFGHVHKSWGCKIVRWNQALIDGEIGEPDDDNAVDHGRSVVILNLATMRWSLDDGPEIVAERQHLAAAIAAMPYVNVGRKIEKGAETCFVNASIQDEYGLLSQKPFYVEVDLPGTIPNGV